jgi:hypothetical protein
MKKQILMSALLLSSASLSAPALAAQSGSYPSFGFEQEFAGVTGNGDIRADIYGGGTATSYGLRVGAFGGEVIVDIAGPAATGVGYKYPFNPHMAAYGKVFTTSGGATSYTNVTGGFSYTGSSGDFLYNGNAEVFSDGLAGQTFTFLKGAGFYQLHTKKMPGRTSLGAELNLQMSPSPSSTNLFLGARWEPKSSVLIDIGVATSTGGTTTFATPAFIRLNLKL